MRYGIYTASLSISYSGVDYTEDWDVHKDYLEQEWEELGVNGQHKVLVEFVNDSVEQYIDLKYWEKI